MTIAYVALGGNEGDRLANLERAVAELAGRVKVTAVSSLYETEPVGFAEQPWFLNAAVAVETVMSAQELLLVLQEIEWSLGKATPFLNGPRTLDLDLLLFDDAAIEEPGLVVPHPRLHERGFVLRPLADIAGDVKHSVLRRSIANLRDRVDDPAVVQPFLERSDVFPEHPLEA